MTNFKSHEWFEIFDHKSKKHVFVNTLSGKCQWNSPDQFQALSDDQCWEMYDFKSKHFYYYNCQSKLKTWLKPNTKNCVSLVRFQMLKERKKKTLVDRATQTNTKTLPEDVNLGKPSLEHSNHKCNNVHFDTFGKMSINSIFDDSELSSTLPITRKQTPRTNPNYDRKNSLNFRLSQPIMGIHNPSYFEEEHFETIIESDSLKNIYERQLMENTCINSKSILTKSGPIYTSNNNYNVPRQSVINAFGLSVPMITEIWSRRLFDKSDHQLAGIMSWTAKSIQNSLLAETPKSFKKKACVNFKQIQMFMGDRDTQFSKDMLAFAICKRGISSTLLANEIFMQLCKQVTHNPNTERIFNGWDLICICLMFFHPESVEMKSCFQSFIEQYACLSQQIDQSLWESSDFNSKSILCARISLKLLAKSTKVLGISVLDISEARKNYSTPTIFYSSLDEVMNIQARFCSNRKLPWIQVALTRETLRCNGAQTQGILRIPCEICKIEALTEAIEKAFKPDSRIGVIVQPCSNECDPLLNTILSDLKFEHDPLLLSSVLRYWLRHFRIPLVSFEDKNESLDVIAQDYSKILKKLDKLSEINYLVLKYLIYFLQVLAKPENVVFTNMPAESLVTVMAPNIFKLDFNQLQPAMNMLHSLIINLDTSDIVNMI